MQELQPVFYREWLNKNQENLLESAGFELGAGIGIMDCGSEWRLARPKETK
jgi:hypothetical protein